ncbi:MAG: ABC transporter substrate-binding protein [Rhodospirillales bacterium]|nr:ABC transporter substrate-binding protein [Acetobacter sp.]
MNIHPVFSSWLLRICGASLLAVALSACHPASEDDGRIVLRYWEKWNGFEMEAMRAVVDDFNASQNRLRVEISSVSQINRKLMLATSGGVPPDVAGLFAEDIPIYAENNALTPLDTLATQAGIRREDYLDAYWQLASHRGVLFGLPSTPNVSALVWNKKMFREAGLDPEQPPRSIAELEAFNEKILRRRPDGGIAQIGHLPNEPVWITPGWGFWFGARYWDGQANVAADSPEMRATFQWLRSYPERFGEQNLLALRDGFGSYASPQNPFMSGRVAMTLQGVWIYNFIKNYAPPDFEWGVAAFPSVDPERLPNVTQTDCDVLVIPVGSKHPREAFEFMRYVNSQGPMEKFCLAQRKFSPLRRVSEDFYRRHPDPYVRVFAELASSPNVRFSPQMTTWNEYNDDLTDATGRIMAGATDVEAVLRNVQRREQAHYDRARERWKRNSEALTAGWASELKTGD